MDTGEYSLAPSVGLLAMAARATGATGVARINHSDLDASEPSFVFHERTQLSKAPSAVSSAMRPTNRDPFADALQIFKGNAASGVFSGGDYSLADAVVLMAPEPR